MNRITLSIIVVLILMTNVSMAPGSNANAEDRKITICHVSSGNPENAFAITVDKNAWEKGDNPHNSHVTDFVIDINNPCSTKQKEKSSDTQIPEFPTIALPAAAVIGLLFLFQHRKRKE